MTMKNTKHIMTILFPALLALTGIFQSCSEEEIMIDPVDLRFDAESEYRLPASSPEPISFVVRSLDDPWEVYSYHPEWCEIIPSVGDMEEKYTVTVQYNDNNELDDRIDTLIIQSDYWIGQWVTVYQKGIAFLDTSVDTVPMTKDAGSGSFYIASNQTWSVEVTEGEDWLALTGETSGEINGQISFSVESNPGEMREGIMTVLDRRGEPAATVTVAQEGAQLDPAETEIRVPYGVTRYELPVESNVSWTVAKDDPAVLWYDFEQTEFDGSDVIVINMRVNESESLNRATFTLRTVAEEGMIPVEKQVVLKQAHDPKPQRHDFSEDGFGDYILVNWDPGTGVIDGNGFTSSGGQKRLQANEMPLGTYTLRFSNASADARAVAAFCFLGGTNPNTQEIWWRLYYDTGMTAISASSYSVQNKQFDTEAEYHDMTLRMTPDGTGFIHIEWLLDGELVYELPSTSQLNAATWDTTMRLYVGGGAGTITLEWIDYTPVVDWNEGEE